ncbi:MAG: type IV toxin-antitoxin system AbiEi family antitoxin domain-containing protein [Candidatus Diapherotrites archaeon]|nr:type IV toxin-antitoxin system AbiEi family antitoxin domain-containing protein [Candidatus Diapherotrites archaeon]
MKYIQDFVKHFSGRLVFSIRDARIFLKQKKISKGYLHFLIHYLLKKGKIKRIAKGVYTFKDDLMACGFAFSPFYYGLQAALSFHGLWDQTTNPVVITNKRVRSGLRTIMGGNVVVKRVNSSMLFGFERVPHYGFWIPVSTPEKTLIDFVYFRQKFPTGVQEQLLKKTNQKLLRQYLKKSPKWVQKRVKKIVRWL